MCSAATALRTRAFRAGDDTTDLTGTRNEVEEELRNVVESLTEAQPRLAIAFAFQGTLSNLLAGVLHLIRQPFAAGHQIEVRGERGTARGITIRETHVETFDGGKTTISNAEVNQHAILVQTADVPSRQTHEIGLEDGDDFDTTTRAIARGMHDADIEMTAPITEIDARASVSTLLGKTAAQPTSDIIHHTTPHHTTPHGGSA